MSTNEKPAEVTPIAPPLPPPADPEKAAEQKAKLQEAFKQVMAMAKAAEGKLPELKYVHAIVQICVASGVKEVAIGDVTITFKD